MDVTLDPFIWHTPASAVDLMETEIHVWRASLRRGEKATAQLLALLTAQETERANRFCFEVDRSAYIAGRGILRLLLGRYLTQEAFFSEFLYNEYGKPMLPEGMIARDLRFNLSHADGVALFAVTCGREVGVDVESVQRNIDYGQVAGRFFSLRERTTLLSLPAEAQREAFFACWTRKEAYIKARGMGLSLGLDAFDVSLAPGEPARLLATRDDPQQAARWSIQALYPGPVLAGALCADGHDWRLRCWQWPDAGDRVP